MSSVLVVGSGGREHALAWKLRQSPAVDRLYVAPGNVGTATVAENVSIAATDVENLVRFVAERSIDLTVVGPEAPLALGLADRLEAAGGWVVGPQAAAARIEWSKAFAKDVMRRAGVPTAAHEVFDDAAAALRYVGEAAYPLAVKADGLAAGKGVVLCASAGEARDAVEAIMVRGAAGPAGRRIVIEEGLRGPEISLLALVDGVRIVPLPVAQDHKRLCDGDRGPNTGGMGAYAPVPWIDDACRDELVALTIEPVVRLLADMGTPYRGVLYAGVMLTADGPRVLEYNCRLGDPETQVILPLLDGDLFALLEATAGGDLRGCSGGNGGDFGEGVARAGHPCAGTRGAGPYGESAVGVVLAAAGYPEDPRVGATIEGLDDVSGGVLVFHAGTAERRGDDGSSRVVTAGGRVLTVVGLGTDVEGAAAAAYAAPIRFEGMQFRTDIGRRPISLAESRNLAYSPLIPNPSPSRGEGRVVAGHAGYPRGDISTANLPSPPEGEGPEVRGHRVAVLASGAGSNLQVLLDAGASGELAAEIVAVVSHDPGAGSLHRAREAGVPAIALSIADRRDPEQRRRLEEDLLRTLARYAPDLVVLAGWMLVLSANFLDRCPCPLINVHPALLPADGRGDTLAIDGDTRIPVLRGANAVREAIARRLPATGVSVHHVTAEVDAGPVVLSAVVPIHEGDDDDALYRRIKPVEHRLLTQAVRLVLTSGGVHA